MATTLSLIFVTIFSSITICLSEWTDTNCTYLQVQLDTTKGTYLISYVPYVCMSYGKTSSGMFECQSNGLIKYSEFDDAECDPSTAISGEIATDLTTGSSIQIDSDSSIIRDFNCNETEANATCEFLDIRVYSSCDSFDSQFYDEVYLTDKCVPTVDGTTYQIIECTWFNATVYNYDDAQCTQNERIAQYLYDDSVLECTDSCRDLSNCRRNFTLCSTHPWSLLANRCDWTSEIAREFFCEDQAIQYVLFSVLSTILTTLCIVF